MLSWFLVLVRIGMAAGCKAKLPHASLMWVASCRT